MILFYAVGGGLGHISRSLSLAKQLSFKEFKIITALGTAVEIVPTEHLIVIDKSLQGNLDALRSYLSKLIGSLSPSSVYIDSFPLGLLGELTEFEWPERVKKTYVSRLIQWEKYRKMFSGDLPNFEEVLIIEELYKSHMNFLKQNFCLKILSIVKDEVFPKLLSNESYGLICHSGNEQELDELCLFAMEIRALRKSQGKLFLISTIQPEKLSGEIKWHSSNLARQYFAKAEFLVSACGFNVMNECQPFKGKHYYIPFERKFDDQFYRAEKYRRKTESS